MSKAVLFTLNGERSGEMDLPDTIFAAPVKQGTLYHAVRNYLANNRRGTACAKDRGQVAFSGIKPWRQKGTGRARVGSKSSPVWRHGGVAMGPKPRDFSYSVPKKVRRSALKSALTDLAGAGKVFVIEDFTAEKPKTKAVAELIKKMGISTGEKCLILIHTKDENVKLSTRNIANVELRMAKDVNALDVLRCDRLIATKESVQQLKEVFSS
jgi:large subunit ribosomal protein L4